MYAYYYISGEIKLCFTPVIYFFQAVIFEAEERRPAGSLPGCRNMVEFYNADQRGSYLSLHFEWRKSANFAG